MAKLSAWSVDPRLGADASTPPPPTRIGRSHIELEKHLEDWIANDVALIADGLTLVGRQVSIDDGRLDLLAIDSQDRWVVIEVKPGMLDAGALGQALYYAASIVRLDAEQLGAKLIPGLGRLGDAERLAARVKQQLDGEEEEREVAVLLVGAGVHPGLERMSAFLGRFGVPIGIVSFDVFETHEGTKLLIREVVEEQAEPTRPRRRLTVDAIRNWAAEVGVAAQFDRFVRVSEAAGLAVQPQRASIRIAPPTNRTRFLMYARPQRGSDGGELVLEVGPKRFAEFFPHIKEEAAAEALRGLEDGKGLSGAELDEGLDQIERFLTNQLPGPRAEDR